MASYYGAPVIAACLYCRTKKVRCRLNTIPKLFPTFFPNATMLTMCVFKAREGSLVYNA